MQVVSWTQSCRVGGDSMEMACGHLHPRVWSWREIHSREGGLRDESMRARRVGVRRGKAQEQNSQDPFL